jgi:hypothetical protein
MPLPAHRTNMTDDDPGYRPNLAIGFATWHASAHLIAFAEILANLPICHYAS